MRSDYLTQYHVLGPINDFKPWQVQKNTVFYPVKILPSLHLLTIWQSFSLFIHVLSILFSLPAYLGWTPSYAI